MQAIDVVSPGLMVVREIITGHYAARHEFDDMLADRADGHDA